jgi:alanyl-tRNA synthetase
MYIPSSLLCESSPKFAEDLKTQVRDNPEELTLNIENETVEMFRMYFDFLLRHTDYRFDDSCSEALHRVRLYAMGWRFQASTFRLSVITPNDTPFTFTKLPPSEDLREMLELAWSQLSETDFVARAIYDHVASRRISVEDEMNFENDEERYIQRLLIREPKLAARVYSCNVSPMSIPHPKAPKGLDDDMIRKYNDGTEEERQQENEKYLKQYSRWFII